MNITTTITGTTARITPHGELDLGTLPSLRAVVDRLPPQVTDLLWDLEHLPFTDIAGLRLIFAPAPHHRTTMTGLQDQPLQLLLIAADLFPAIYDLTRLIPHTPADLIACKP
ncbi:hypothetical protein GCM10010497_59220 [Streptomyces cinereoruber]|uniref:STAS domain-containing protein n=1 Tax=Streptomyces cinereoruber TaxID=67260 RepID=A0AAV4KU13_9ACTN|nr:hypothetical protein [Streptomyces cinereoruber]MBB4161731.1 hypothetical protein [Streptomyces cinereoruber]MBY8820047.1 hypothetical protein [Streptomyces cinereoruber]NIH65416.1 hypothetical protein [Streptomyces cinereoruber]QEV30858.1 hypothetical protein CP977_00425 [Streptomyces cinereoruber]GGR48008.1 hypothetical protein GCM10010497_59220 [Streptomyces cinereoruber]